MIVENLNNMLKDLSQHNRSRETLLPFYVDLRLTKSIQSYYADLLAAQKTLEERDARKVLKALSEEDN